MIKKLIPDYVFKSIYDIDFNKLYNDGIRLILSDLDNTLISYKQKEPYEDLFKWKKNLEDMGFEFIIVSNSRKERVTNFANKFNVKCNKFSTKPLKRGIKRAIKKLASKKYNNDEIILIGDQLMTDILGAKRSKIKAGLVYPVDIKTEPKTTRFNRKMEQFFLNRIKKKKSDIYNMYLKEFDELND